MSSFDIFSHHHKDISFELKRHPEHVLPKLNPLIGQNLVRIATFDKLFCVKKPYLIFYLNLSSGGVNFLAWYLTRFNSNPTGKVSGSLVDHFDQTRNLTTDFPCSLNQLQIDQCLVKNVHQKIKQFAQSTDQGVSSIRLNLYQTSFLSHFLSIWCMVVSMLHFLTPTVYRTNLSASTKNAFFRGVRTANTPSFCTFSHQIARRKIPIITSNSVCSELIFGLVQATRSMKRAIFVQKNMQHIGVLKFNPYISRISRKIRLNRTLYVEQATDQGLGLNRRDSYSRTRLPRGVPIVLNDKPKMQLLNLTQQRNGGLTCTKFARFRGVRTANTPIFALFVYQHGACKTELVGSDSILSINSFRPLWRIELVKLPLIYL